MSEFLALGLSLSQVVEMTTANPAQVLREEHRRGSLRVGFPADVTLFEWQEGDFLFVDGRDGNRLRGNRLLVPRLTVKRGAKIEISPRFRNYARWSHDVSQTMATRTSEERL
jgi:dihydroorotase